MRPGHRQGRIERAPTVAGLRQPPPGGQGQQRQPDNEQTDQPEECTRHPSTFADQVSHGFHFTRPCPARQDTRAYLGDFAATICGVSGHNPDPA